MINNNNWSPESWKQYTIKQQVNYDNEYVLQSNLKKITNLPTIIEYNQVQNCIKNLATIKSHNKFLLQMGECSESFKEFGQDYINGYINLFRETSTNLNLETINVARLGGQFSKPRTFLTEKREDTTLINYRGDMINNNIFSAASRLPDPNKLIEAYAQSALTANLTANEFYLSHEALILEYEQQYIKKTSDNQFYSSAAHMLWIGKRTNFLDSAHIEFISGICNPIEIKIDHTFNIEELEQIINKIGHIPGRLTLVGRFGADYAESKLNDLCKILKKYTNIIYICDPMHGNSYISENGTKTRNTQDIIKEIEITVLKLKEYNLSLNGIMLEVYFDNIAECLGENIDNSNLGSIYSSNCDPRLNPTQTKKIISVLNKLLS